MFAQAQRLDRTMFTYTYTHGRKVHMPGFLLIYLKAPALAVAVVVGKKVTKSAVARNQIKRRLYAALYETKVPTGRIIMMAKPAANAYGYAQLQAEINVALHQAFGSRAYSR
jgi:ribonuclease P protein component